MDVKTVFLHGRLSKIVYMTPPGYVAPSSHVYRLQHDIYGLNQAPRA